MLGEGRGFEIAQGRLGRGRMHHCLSQIGDAQRSLELACKRAKERTTFGKFFHKNQSVGESISKCFSEIEMGRLLMLKTCQKMDDIGLQAAQE